MADSVTTVVYPVKDADKAKALFTVLLGTPPAYDEPYYIGWDIDGQNIGLDPHGFEQGMTGPVAYVEVADVKARLGALVAAGASIVQNAKDVGGGTLIASVRDADGNVLGLRQAAG